MSEEFANKSNLTDLCKGKESYESSRRFGVWLFVSSNSKERNLLPKVPNKCLSGLDFIFTGDKKSLNIRLQDSLIRLKAHWYINEDDGKTRILMLNEFTEKALR